ncbi:MAG: type II toxin-antitoxin system HicB family antitoxin [Elusimicrobia bacterium]|nr:type II toxin-antitoxin system HicB family antitoxin [Candidatus Liberimonas magnetica]
MDKKYSAIYEKRGKWYIGYIKELAGVNSQGKTLKEVKRNLKEALNLVLDAKEKLSYDDKMPDKVFRESIFTIGK